MTYLFIASRCLRHYTVRIPGLFFSLVEQVVMTFFFFGDTISYPPDLATSIFLVVKNILYLLKMVVRVIKNMVIILVLVKYLK